MSCDSDADGDELNEAYEKNRVVTWCRLVAKHGEVVINSADREEGLGGVKPQATDSPNTRPPEVGVGFDHGPFPALQFEELQILAPGAQRDKRLSGVASEGGNIGRTV